MISKTPSSIKIEIPLVSVCIPTCNRSKKLAFCVKELIKCDYPNLQIIISDNGSTDDTAEVGAAFELADGRIRYYRHPTNLGPTRNFEFARSKANGKYFLWHSDDDYLDCNYISACVSALESDASLVLASGLSIYDRDDQVAIKKGNIIQLCSNSPTLRIFEYLWRVQDNSVFYGTYRLESVRECVLPNILGGDWAWLVEVLLIGKAKVISDAFIHRETRDSTSSSPEGYARIVRMLGLPMWNSVYPEYAITLSIVHYILIESRAFSAINSLHRVFIAAIALFVVLAKFSSQLLSQYLRRIPFVLSVYRRLRHRTI